MDACRLPAGDSRIVTWKVHTIRGTTQWSTANCIGTVFHCFGAGVVQIVSGCLTATTLPARLAPRTRTARMHIMTSVFPWRRRGSRAAPESGRDGPRLRGRPGQNRPDAAMASYPLQGAGDRDCHTAHGILGRPQSGTSARGVAIHCAAGPRPRAVVPPYGPA
jgi:hypothetical protein